MPQGRRPFAVAALMAAIAFLGLAPGAESFRVANWNVLNFPGGTGATREPYFRTVAGAMDADLIVVQEMLSLAGQTQFLNNVLNTVEPGEWAAATFVDGYDTDSALFYKTARFSLIGQATYTTDLRNIQEYTLRVAGYSGAGAEFKIYSTHLKAGTTSTDLAKRLAECTVWRDAMNLNPTGAAFLACGDYNIQSSSEASYQKLLESQADNDGQCHDLINTPGTWHDNASFVMIHTQSTRTTSLPDGGATGGMDDRFDFALSSAAFDDAEGLSYIPGTYIAYGNDGLHFNLSLIADPPNEIVLPEVVTAIYNCSDHIPLIADFQVPAKVSAAPVLAFGDVLVGAAVAEVLSVANCAAAPADELNYSLAAPAGFTAPAGSFQAFAGSGANDHDITMDTAASGPRGGSLTVNSNDVDAPSYGVTLSGAVLDHAQPSVLAGSIATLDTLDFGAHPAGGFSDQQALLHNVDFDTYQALLDVYDAAVTGSTRFSIDGGFEPSTAGATPAEYMVHFDAAGATSGVYTGLLTFHTRDPQALPGAQNLADLAFHITAEVTEGIVTVDAPPIAETRLYGAAPNPLRWPAAIRFDLCEAGPVRVDVFDVRGRLLRTLVHRDASAGAYTAFWDGRDAAGRAAGAGVYFARMQTRRMIETRPMVVAR